MANYMYLKIAPNVYVDAVVIIMLDMVASQPIV